MIFKIGDSVICNINGHGIILELNYRDGFPILVKFSDHTDYYTSEGRMYLPVDDDGEHIQHLTKLELALK